MPNAKPGSIGRIGKMKFAELTRLKLKRDNNNVNLEETVEEKIVLVKLGQIPKRENVEGMLGRQKGQVRIGDRGAHREIPVLCFLAPICTS